MIALVRAEKKRSRPRSSVTVATIATRMVGTAAMIANRPTMRTCSRDPARPWRRACTICMISRVMMATSNNAASPLIPSRLTTTLWVGGSGVRPDKTRKVASADSSAAPTAMNPIARHGRRRGGVWAVDFSSGNDWSALAIAPCDRA
jgi:hypothetical protein